METSDFEQVMELLLPALQVDNRHLQLTLKGFAAGLRPSLCSDQHFLAGPRPTLTPADEPPHPHLPFYGIF